ncbi:MAG: replication restart helicase PriA, partial [Chloroflexota bacterium]
GRAALAALAKKGLVEVIEREVPRETDHQVNERAGPPLPLSPAQKEALEPVVEAINRRRPEIFLLHGVTGSGKTEVYLQAMVETIRQGRQAILMVPEISLTPQAMARVSDRFPGRTASLHSKLSDRERVDAWQHIRSGEVDVVVGPRSALFAPVPRPGLIVADEEHDPSYKQNASPRYHARDAAAVLGRLTGATVIFGSATPDVATFEAARSGRIKLLSLPDRPTWGTAEAARPMPRVEIVDMRQELKQGNRSMFSNSLSESLRRTLAADRQSLLFLNRRGNATVVICRDCGYVVRCKSCDIPFTHHLNHSRLICHRCDRRIASPTSCPACGSGRIRFLGAGTQRVEEAARELLPGARVLRWDRDVTGAKGAHQRILDAFAAHQADILVGTQMIAKGLDFPLVTLVGVVSADTGLHMPDFRAPERSFELLTQVAGRAGRAQMPGEVIIQTYTPEHYAIQAARGHDYHRFFEEEMSFRRDAGYPPFSRLLRFVYSDEDEVRCHDAARLLRAALLRAVEENNISADVIGPAPCFIAKIKNRYFWQIIVRGSGGAALHSLLDYVTAGWTVDVDPVDLL